MKAPTAAEVAEPAPGQKAPRDLFSLRPVRWFLTSPLYPSAFQALSVVVFALVSYFAFFGTIRPGRNLATVVTWTLWWPLLPLSLVLVGRAWCAICPFIPPMALAQRLAKPKQSPGLFLRRYGVWLMAFSFLLLTWGNRVLGFITSPRATGWLLVVLLGLALVLAIRYQRRAFCRHVCPIGALTGLYAMPAVLELRCRGGSCQDCPQLCYRGNPQGGACPLYEFPRTMESNRNCNLCSQCLKICPQNNLGLRLRLPGRELWGLRRPLVGEALLAVILIALVFIQTVDMTTAWGSYVKWMIEGVGVKNYNLILSLTFAGGVGVMVAAYMAATGLSSRGGIWRQSLASYGYAFIPLALAAHLSHNTAHLVFEGPIALRTALANLASLIGINYAVDYSATGSPAFGMSWLVVPVTLGAGLSLLVAWRIGRRLKHQGENSSVWPQLVLLLLVAALFMGLFLLPMNPRHTH